MIQGYVRSENALNTKFRVSSELRGLKMYVVLESCFNEQASLLRPEKKQNMHTNLQKIEHFKNILVHFFSGSWLSLGPFLGRL